MQKARESTFRQVFFNTQDYYIDYYIIIRLREEKNFANIIIFKYDWTIVLF